MPRHTRRSRPLRIAWLEAILVIALFIRLSAPLR